MYNLAYTYLGYNILLFNYIQKVYCSVNIYAYYLSLAGLYL